LGLLLGVAAVSTASTFIRLAQGDVPSLAVAAWRLMLASLMLAPVSLGRCRVEWAPLTRREWGWLAISGVFLAIHFYTWIESLALTSVAASVVLVSLTPLFVAVVSRVFLKETLTRRTVGGIALAIVGSACIALGDRHASVHRLAGDGLALVGAAAIAGHMLIGRRLRARLSLLGYIFPVYGVAAVVLMLCALATGTPLTGYPSPAWLWLLLIALIPQVIGHSSFNWALGHLPAAYVSLATLAEPVGATLLAWLILREAPTWAAVGGGALILIGLGLASWQSRTEESK